MATNQVEEVVSTMFTSETVQSVTQREHLQWEDRDYKRESSMGDAGSEGTKRDTLNDDEDWESSDDELDARGDSDDSTDGGPVPEELLATDPSMGLADADVRVRQKKYGKNMLKEETESVWKQLLNYFWGPVQVMIEAAAILSLALRKWIDLGMIIGLLVLNAIVGFLQEGQAGNAIAELKKELALKATVTRNGRREEIDATELTVGDILHVSEGDVVPADARLIGEGAFLQVDQSSLTGESLAVRKGQNDPLYSSSAIKRGQGTAVVTSIGDMTFIGRAAALVQSTKRVGHFTEVLNQMGLGLIFAAYVSVFIVFISSYFRGVEIVDILRYSASLVVVAVPIALPAVITTTLAVGAAKLARKQAIVSRLTAIESLAGVDVLCTDKTGTLTQNKLKVVQPPFIMRGTTTEMLFSVAALSSQRTRKGIDPIDKAVMKTVHRHYKQILPIVNSYRVVEFQPFDPVSKRILVRLEKDGEEYIALKGAPQVVLEHCQQEGSIEQEQADDYNNAVDEFARRGYRSIGVALHHPHKGWELVGIISLFDPPRYDTKDTIDRAVELGLTVKMLTGDQLAIAKETAQQLGMGQDIYEVSALGLGSSKQPSKELADFVEKADGFAQVFPEHKHQVVDILQRRGHFCAMTGDGVNDAPSLKKADVGIAVADAANAARSAASIVFMEAGLGVIIDAIKTSRQIFHRMESYMQYRVALSIHVLIYLTGAIVIFGYTPIELTLTVFIAIFSDISVLMIAYDRAPFSQSPVRWNLPRLMFSAVVLGLTLAAGTWVLHGFTLADPKYHGKTSMMAFLEIALTENWVILSTRTGGGFWRFRPGWQLVTTLIIVDIVASVMALYASNFAETIDIVAVVRVWLYSIGVFLVIDFVNMGLNRLNNARGTSYEDTEEIAHSASKEKKPYWSKDQLRELEDHILVLERVTSTRRPDDDRAVPLRSWRTMFARRRSDAQKDDHSLKASDIKTTVYVDRRKST